MLSAQKQEMPSDTPPETSRPPTATGFGKVLNSIQGLQQRLDDFSIEQVSSAHAQANVLIRELGDLQAQLTALAKLKQATASVNGQIAAIPEDNFDLVGPDSLEKHPQLRVIVQAGKLIRMHRLLQAAQASAQSVSFDLETNIPGGDLISEQSVELIQTKPLPTREQPGVSFLDSVTSAGIAEEKNEVTAGPERQSSAVAGASRGQDSKPTPTYEFTELKLEERPHDPSLATKDSLPVAMPRARQSSTRKGKKPEAKPHIDQRLLNDLIETYGEFAISTKPVASLGAAATGTPTSVESAGASTMLMPVQTMPVTTTQAEALLIAPTPVEPAFVQTSDRAKRALPAEERAEPSFEEALPTAKSRGEIDRQLKNIIKDYGEYDLYSQQKSLNMKTAVIAAAAVLGLVLGGLYFFKSPPAPAPAAIQTTVPSEGTAAQTPQPGVTKYPRQEN
jgi:hypothetical protein